MGLQLIGQSAKNLPAASTTAAQVNAVQGEMGIPSAVFIQRDVLPPGLELRAAKTPGVFRLQPFHLAGTVADQDEIAFGVLVDAFVLAAAARLDSAQ
ncbi:hypothetical protein D3C79_728190 [compost metagenome]